MTNLEPDSNAFIGDDEGSIESFKHSARSIEDKNDFIAYMLEPSRRQLPPVTKRYLRAVLTAAGFSEGEIEDALKWWNVINTGGVLDMPEGNSQNI